MLNCNEIRGALKINNKFSTDDAPPPPPKKRFSQRKMSTFFSATNKKKTIKQTNQLGIIKKGHKFGSKLVTFTKWDLL